MKNKEALLEDPIEIAIILKNNLGEDLEFESDDKSFNFVYSKND